MTANVVGLVAASLLGMIFASIRGRRVAARAPTERRAREEAARTSYAAVERMRRLIDVVPHPLLQLNAKGEITVANSAAIKKFGVSRADLIGMSFRNLISEEMRPSILDRLAHAFEQRDASSLVESTQCMTSDGRAFSAEISVGPIILDRGVQLVLVIVDVSAREAWASQLKRQQDLLEERNEELANLNKTAFQFVDSVSHDFRTPLTVIKEYASLLGDELLGEVNDEQKRILSVIDNRVEDLNAMVDDMLDISKLESGILGVHRTSCSVAAIFDRVGSTLQHRANSQDVQFQIELPDELPDVYGDPDKAARAIINFGINAIKFCGERGQVTLFARHNADNHEVQIGVADNGPGIPQEQIAELYQRFRQLEQGARHTGKGFGLGLSIAKQLVNMNFGRTGVESKLGQGSTFWFTLPVDDCTTVIQRSLTMLRQLPWPANSQVCVLRASAVDATSAASSELDELLHCRLRASEVCVPAERNTWLMLLVRRPDEMEDFFNEWQQLAEEANMNRPSGALPAVTLSTIGSWPISAVDDKALSLAVEANLNPETV